MYHTRFLRSPNGRCECSLPRCQPAQFYHHGQNRRRDGHRVAKARKPGVKEQMT